MLLAASVLVGTAGFFLLTSQAQAVEQKALVAESAEKRTDAVRDEIKTTIAQVQPIQDKLDFVKKVDAYRERWIVLYTTLADKTAQSGFIYTDASVTGATMTIKAYSPKVHDVTVYLQAMYQEPDFQSVMVDKVVGFPANTRHLYYLDGHLVFADGAASTPSEAAPPNSSQPDGVRQAPPGYTPDQIGPYGPDNLPLGVGPPPPEIAVKNLGGFGSATPAGSHAPDSAAASGYASYSPAFLRVAGRNINPLATSQIREQILQQALRRVVVRTVPKGFDITVTATLKQPLTPPTPPGIAPPAGATGPAAAPSTEPHDVG